VDVNVQKKLTKAHCYTKHHQKYLILRVNFLLHSCHCINKL